MFGTFGTCLAPDCSEHLIKISPKLEKIKTDIPKSQHVDFWCFGVILSSFGLILVKCSEQSWAKHVPNVPHVPNVLKVPNTNIVPGQHSSDLELCCFCIRVQSAHGASMFDAKTLRSWPKGSPTLFKISPSVA